MASSKYIKPMGFVEIITTMFRLYFSFFLPILLLNIIIVAMSWWVLIVGAFVGPVLLMTSNAILGKPLKIVESFRKGIFSAAFIKIAVSSIIYVGAVFLLAMSFPLEYALYIYIALVPLWIFTPMIILLEKKGLWDSVKRSFYILRNNLGKILQIDILILVVYTLVAVLLGFGDFSTGLIIAFFIPLLTGFSSLPYVFVYYEFRARHENYSEELLAQELGYQPLQEMMSI
jgi:hypothetical protein